MKFAAIVLAAGRSERFGSSKLWENLGDKPVWKWSFDTLCRHPQVSAVGIVALREEISRFTQAAPQAAFVCAGGSSRSDSVRNGIALATELGDGLLLQDAARPFVSSELITAVCDAVETDGAACPGISVTDTIKINEAGRLRTLPRDQLVAVQTPQGATCALFQAAYAEEAQATDDMAMLEAIGVKPVIVPGNSENLKITHESDLIQARTRLNSAEVRTGFGYDVHAMSPDPGRKMMLGGLLFEGVPGLAGHSDADVLVHAAVDALLGAVAKGDIGTHFPDTDPRWAGQASLHFLSHAAALLAVESWDIVSLDVTVVAENPKIMPHAGEICRNLSEAMRIQVNRVSVKATTNEGLGSIGKGEGVCAYAVATVRRLA